MARALTDESRRYRILDVVGEGGFGKVYRARLEGAEGFAKDVAIKLLTDKDAPEDVLQRFRDESRILGLVRDRAIVTVDPPTRLDGRWAVVMEFVDGANCERLMRKKPIPPRPALEIVQEVARALDNVFHQEGPDGEPLHLIHRDIKPGNIQVTPSGTVKILDFGTARARFDSRETTTTAHIGGTFGYIAPERLQGTDGPSGDVYSLGVVLAALICGRRPTPKNVDKLAEWVRKDPDLLKVWQLALEMQSPNAETRPTAREVEDMCAEIGPSLRGGPLRRWAEDEVRQAVIDGEDRLVGSVLTETMAYLPRFDTSEMSLSRFDRRPSPIWRGLAFMAAGAVIVIVVFTLGSAVGFGFLAAIATQLGFQVDQQPETIYIERPAPVAPPIPITPPVPVAEPEPVVEPEPEAAPAPEPSARPSPRPRPRPQPRPAAATVPITFGSIPVGAMLYVDGKKVGQTPIVGHKLTEGSHQIRMTLDGREGTRTITVGNRGAVRYIWKGGSEWQVFY